MNVPKCRYVKHVASGLKAVTAGTVLHLSECFYCRCISLINLGEGESVFMAIVFKCVLMLFPKVKTEM